MFQYKHNYSKFCNFNQIFSFFKFCELFWVFFTDTRLIFKQCQGFLMAFRVIMSLYMANIMCQKLFAWNTIGFLNFSKYFTWEPSVFTFPFLGKFIDFFVLLRTYIYILLRLRTSNCDVVDSIIGIRFSCSRRNNFFGDTIWISFFFDLYEISMKYFQNTLVLDKIW